MLSRSKRVCEKAGIKGYKTNHSLRVTTATRLFHSGLDEQLIMEQTGHRSADGVRSYKRSSVQQQEVVSRILNREKVTDGRSLQDTVLPPVPVKSVPKSQTPTVDASTPSTTPSTSLIPHNALVTPPVNVTPRWMVSMQPEANEEYPILNDIAPSLMVTRCTGITINYNFGK